MNTHEAIQMIREVSAEAEKLFGRLDTDTLNTKPAPDKWSIAQCQDHLMVSNRTYYPQFKEVADKTHQNTLYQRIGIISRFMGNWLVKATGPDRSKTMKNPPAFTPTQGNLPGTIVADFLLHQMEMENWFRRMSHADLHKTILSSPALAAITYNLSDLLQILTGHEQRHLNQAKEVLKTITEKQ